MLQFSYYKRIVYLIFVQIVNSREPKCKMAKCNKEVKWTALPKLCMKCLSVKRKQRRTDDVTSKLYFDSGPEPMPIVAIVDPNTEHTAEDCVPDSLTLREDMSHSAACSSGTSICNDAVVCASLSAATTSSGSQNLNCLSSKKHSSNVLTNNSKVARTDFVQPAFWNSIFKLNSEFCAKEADDACSVVAAVKVVATENVQKDLDLHRCPLCDMVFDIRWVYCITCVCCISIQQFQIYISKSQCSIEEASQVDSSTEKTKPF